MKRNNKRTTTRGNLGAYAGAFLIVFVFSMILTYIIISNNLGGFLSALGNRGKEESETPLEIENEEFFEEPLSEVSLLEPGDGDNASESSSENSEDASEESKIEEANVPEKISPSDMTSVVVPKVLKTDNNYFKHSLFVGDRQIMEFSNNKVDMVKFSLAKDEVEPEKAISANIFGKTGLPNNLVTSIGKYKPSHIYLMLGARSLAYLENKDSILHYKKFIDEIKKIQPTVPIYIQSVLPVTKEYEEELGYKNTKILELNEELKKMCEEKGLYYLDVSKDLQASDGYLKSEYANSDSLILNKDGQNIWEEYLKTHWIDF